MYVWTKVTKINKLNFHLQKKGEPLNSQRHPILSTVAHQGVEGSNPQGKPNPPSVHIVKLAASQPL
jgi:hypothetical protein